MTADPYRPDEDPANANVRSWVYMVHLDPPYKHADHYCGTADDLAARLAKHGTSEGARLLQVQREAGGTWHLVRTWPGGRWEERAIKQRKEAPTLCPDCTPGTERGALDAVRRAAERIRAEYSRRFSASPETEADGDEVLLGPEARGREDAARLLAWLPGASADEIEQAAAARQTPYYEGVRTPEGDAEQGAFAEVITAAVERLRESGQVQIAPAQPEEVTVSTNTPEWVKGAQTAHDLVARQVEAGQDADTIAAKWDQALATYDDATATGAQREWHAGAEETARDMIQTWRDMQREEAEQAQAARDQRQAGPEPEMEMEAG